MRGNFEIQKEQARDKYKLTLERPQTTQTQNKTLIIQTKTKQTQTLNYS